MHPGATGVLKRSASRSCLAHFSAPARTFRRPPTNAMASAPASERLRAWQPERVNERTSPRSSGRAIAIAAHGAASCDEYDRLRIRAFRVVQDFARGPQWWLRVAGGRWRCGFRARARGAVIGSPSRVAPNGLVVIRLRARCDPVPASGQPLHARGHGVFSAPGSALYAGGAQPRCHPGHDRTDDLPVRMDRSVRPSESITEPEKYASMAAYGDTGSASGYEYAPLRTARVGRHHQRAPNTVARTGCVTEPQTDKVRGLPQSRGM